MSHPNLLCALLIHELREVVFFIAAVAFTVFGKHTTKCKKRKDHCEMATDCSLAKNLPPKMRLFFFALGKLPNYWLFGIPREFNSSYYYGRENHNNSANQSIKLTVP